MSRLYGGTGGARNRRRGAPAPDLGARPGRLRAADPGLSLVRLAAAVREHQAVAGDRSVPKRPADHELYRRLDAIERTFR